MININIRDLVIINTPDQFLLYDRLTGKIYQVILRCKQICEYVSSES